MNTDLIFTGNEILTTTALVFAFFLLLIGGLRVYFRRIAQANLTEKYQNTTWGSPLQYRNKYPDVDVNKLRGPLLGLSLVAVLFITLAAFNWTSFTKEVDVSMYSLDLEEEIEVAPPRSAEPPPPPPPPPPPVIQEVPNELIIEEDEIEFVDQSVEITTEVFTPDPVIVDHEDVPPPPPPPPPPKAAEPEEIFKVVEQMPRFPGCEDSGLAQKELKACADKKLMEFLYSNIEYPSIARENNIQGTVVVGFVVEKDGSITQIKILRDIGGQCGDEAVRVVKMMRDQEKKWIPGKQRGIPVRVMFNLPIRFILKDA